MLKTTVKVGGMMCGMCESHINDAVRAEFNVKKVSSSRRKGETVIISEQSINVDKLAKAIKAAGYNFGGATEEEYQKKGIFSSLK